MGAKISRQCVLLFLFVCALAFEGCGVGALAFEGNGVGGGGIVVCQDSKGNLPSVQLLDFYEASILQPIRNVSLGNFQTVIGKVQYAIDRLSKVDEKKAELYREGANQFFNHVTWRVKGFVLSDSNDFGYVPLEPQCEIQQICLQTLHDSDQSSSYEIDESSWAKLSVDHQAGLVLHELVYGEALRKGQKSSVNSRKFTALMASDDIANMTTEKYVHLVRKLSLQTSDELEVAFPMWVMEPLQLSASRVGINYTRSLVPFAFHPDGLKMNFSKVSGPDWLTVEADGRISGVPTRVDLHDKNKTFIFSATDSNGAYATVSSRIQQVEPGIGSPVQIMGPITMEIAAIGIPWRFNISPYVISGGGDSSKFLFDAQSLPNWMTLDPKTGIISGTPSWEDIGEYTGISIEVTQSNHTARTTANGFVTDKALPPKWIQRVDMLPEATVGKLYLVDLRTFTNVSGRKMVFFVPPSAFTLPGWLTLSNDGLLLGVPDKATTGSAFGLIFDITFQLTTAEGKKYHDVQFHLRVNESIRCPYWMNQPIVAVTRPNVGFSLALSDFANSFGGKFLTFDTRSMPSWLGSDETGQIAGVAEKKHLGTNAFFASVSNGICSIPNKVIVRVE